MNTGTGGSLNIEIFILWKPFLSSLGRKFTYLKTVSVGLAIHDAFTTEINTEWKEFELFSRKDIIARKINDRKVCLPTSFFTTSLCPARQNSSYSVFWSSYLLSRSCQSYPLALATAATTIWSILVRFYLLFGYLLCMSHLYTTTMS